MRDVEAAESRGGRRLAGATRGEPEIPGCRSVRCGQNLNYASVRESHIPRHISEHDRYRFSSQDPRLEPQLSGELAALGRRRQREVSMHDNGLLQERQRRGDSDRREQTRHPSERAGLARRHSFPHRQPGWHEISSGPDGKQRRLGARACVQRGYCQVL